MCKPVPAKYNVISSSGCKCACHMIYFETNTPHLLRSIAGQTRQSEMTYLSKNVVLCSESSSSYRSFKVPLSPVGFDL